jgi:glycosyltransferase involved in cell wall biosynthesis
MLEGKRIVVVMPAYNAEQTIEQTHAEIPKDIVDEVVVVDDHSDDATAAVAARLGLSLVIHDRNRGYGANQKTCYQEPWIGALTSS